MASQKIYTTILSSDSTILTTVKSISKPLCSSVGEENQAGICITYSSISQSSAPTSTFYSIKTTYNASIPYNAPMSAGGTSIPRTWNITDESVTLVTTIPWHSTTDTVTLGSITPTVNSISFTPIGTLLNAKFNFTVEYETDKGLQTITVITDET